MLLVFVRHKKSCPQAFSESADQLVVVEFRLALSIPPIILLSCERLVGMDGALNCTDMCVYVSREEPANSRIFALG